VCVGDGERVVDMEGLAFARLLRVVSALSFLLLLLIRGSRARSRSFSASGVTLGLQHWILSKIFPY